MKLIEAINEAKQRANASGHVGYAAHPIYDVWAMRNRRGVCTMDIRPRTPHGTPIATTMARLRSSRWREIVKEEG
jgi:hypothetical protein